MDFVKLTQEQMQFFDDEGYLVVEDVLSQDEVESYTEACDAVMADYNARNQMMKQTRAGMVEMQVFQPLIAHSSTVPLVIQLLSPDIHLQNTAILYKEPEDPGSSEPVRAWHRDIGITQEMGHAHQPRIGIKVCYCLTDFPGPDSGMTRFSRHSHLLNKPLGIPRGEIDPPNVVQPVCKAGDAVFFENRIFHTKSPNLSDHTSKAIIFGYSYHWMRNGYYIEDLDAAVVGHLSDIEKQLLDIRLSDNPNYRARPNSYSLTDWAEKHDVVPGTVPFTVEI